MVDGRHSTRRAVREGRASLVNQADAQQTSATRSTKAARSKPAPKPSSAATRTKRERDQDRDEVPSKQKKQKSCVREKSRQPPHAPGDGQTSIPDTKQLPSAARTSTGELAGTNATEIEPGKHDVSDPPALKADEKLVEEGETSLHGASQDLEEERTAERERQLEVVNERTDDDEDVQQPKVDIDEPSGVATQPKKIPDTPTPADFERIRAKVRDELSDARTAPAPLYPLERTAQKAPGPNFAKVDEPRQEHASPQRESHPASLQQPSLSPELPKPPPASYGESRLPHGVPDLPRAQHPKTLFESLKQPPSVQVPDGIDYAATEIGEDFDSLFGEDPTPPVAEEKPTTTLALPKIASTSDAPRELSPAPGAPAQRLPGLGSRLPGLGHPQPSHAFDAGRRPSEQPTHLDFEGFERLLEGRGDYGKGQDRDDATEEDGDEERSGWDELIEEQDRSWPKGDDEEEDEAIRSGFEEIAEENGFAADGGDEQDEAIPSGFEAIAEEHVFAAEADDDERGNEPWDGLLTPPEVSNEAHGHTSLP